MTNLLTQEERIAADTFVRFVECTSYPSNAVMRQVAALIIPMLDHKPPSLGEVARAAFRATSWDVTNETAWESAAEAVKEALRGGT